MITFKYMNTIISCLLCAKEQKNKKDKVEDI